MITEDYVSFETAKLLREKGFDEKCPHYWQDEISEYSIAKEIHKWTDSALANTEISGSKRFSAPTIQMAMKWLREVHNLFIEIMVGDDDGKIWYDFDVINIGKKDMPIVPIDDVVELETYEQACEAAIKYCLENLIWV